MYEEILFDQLIQYPQHCPLIFLTIITRRFHALQHLVDLFFNYGGEVGGAMLEAFHIFFILFLLSNK
jgi:hypothetical protein